MPPARDYQLAFNWLETEHVNLQTAAYTAASTHARHEMRAELGLGKFNRGADVNPFAGTDMEEKYTNAPRARPGPMRVTWTGAPEGRGRRTARRTGPDDHHLAGARCCGHGLPDLSFALVRLRALKVMVVVREPPGIAMTKILRKYRLPGDAACGSAS